MKLSRNALFGKVSHVPAPRRRVFIDVVVVLVVRIGTARTHLSYLVALKGVIARKNDSRKAKVFKVGDCISHSNKKYTTETFKLLFYIRYQTPSFCFFICAFLFRVNLFNLFIWSASNCVMKFWSRANIFILVQYYFPTNSSELVS